MATIKGPQKRTWTSMAKYKTSKDEQLFTDLTELFPVKYVEFIRVAYK